MRAVSAADSISLAIDRTKTFLFRPFRWGTFLKLGLVAIITEGFSSNLRSGSNKNHPSGQGPSFHSLQDIPHAWIVAGVAAVLLAIVVSLVVAYLITPMIRR